MSQKELKPLDVDKTYAQIVKYYVDKKGYTVEKANGLAQRVVEREQARRVNQTVPETTQTKL